MQPFGVALIDDDFGYVRSVIETLQRGRPWTDEWLEPWSAGLSVLTGLLYRLTGSFELAVHGFLALCATASFGASVVLLLHRGLTRGSAVFYSALLLAFPTLLWKAVQFTGVALYLPCLLLALVMVEKRRWAWFFVFWAMALTTRQSAVIWGVLPLAGLWQCLHDGTRRQPGEGARIVGVILASLGLFAAMSSGMNKTHSQLLLTDRLFQNVQWSTFVETLGLGCVLLVCAIGLGSFVVSDRPGTRVREAVSWGRVLLAGVIAVAIGILDPRTRIQTEHRLLSSELGWLYSIIVVAIAAAGWTLFRGRFHWPNLVGAIGSLFFVALRPQVWDYYFLDLAVLGFFAVTQASSIGPATSAKSVSSRWFKAAALPLAGIQVILLLELKGAVDKSYALCRIHEEAVRAGRISPAEIGKAPFGFHGWYFHRWYARHEGRTAVDIAGFHTYIRGGAIVIGKTYSPALHRMPTFQDRLPSREQQVVGVTTSRHLWFFEGRYYLLRPSDRRALSPGAELPAEYQPPRFPLNDGEWRDLIESPNR
jgi:hypothetical protein